MIGPRASSARGVVPALLLALILAEAPIMAMAADAPAGSVAVEVRGRAVQVMLPRGMGVYRRVSLADSTGEVRALLLPDSLLSGPRIPPPGQPDFAAVSASAQGPEDLRRDIAEAGAAPGDLLRSCSSDDGIHARAQEVLRADPEGASDVPVPLPAGKNAGLGLFVIGRSALVRLQAHSENLDEGPAPLLVGLAQVILHGRVVQLSLVRFVAPTSRSAALLRHDMEDWVRGTLAANPGAAEDGRPATSPAGSGASGPKEGPRFGEYVEYDRLPESLVKVPPVYPEVGRLAGISGTVLIQALVGRDGRILAQRVVRSIPLYDAAALAAVRQWTFVPAQNRGRPIAVWVAIPVKFSLQ